MIKRENRDTYETGTHTFQPKVLDGMQGWECVHCNLWHDFPRGAKLPKEIDQCPGRRTCLYRDCDVDVTEEVSYGHCLECYHHIGARTFTEWSRKIEQPCPKCGKPW